MSPDPIFTNTHVSAGRVQTITSPATTGVTTLQYNARGQETLRSGTGSYPIERSYTAYARETGNGVRVQLLDKS